MKFKPLGLKRGRGVVYTVTSDGKILATSDGVTKTIKKLKLPETKDFLYFIDDDGDLAREFRAPPRPRDATPRTHPTQPASAKLDARALYKRIDALLFPPDRDHLAHSGFVEDNIDRSRRAYEKEFARLAREISRALGPGIEIETDVGSPGFVWWLRDRPVLMTLDWEDKEFPGSIELVPLDPNDSDVIALRSSPKSRRRAKA